MKIFKPVNDFHIILWLFIITMLLAGCTTGVGALWKMHKDQERNEQWMKDTYNKTVDTNGVVHWEKK